MQEPLAHATVVTVEPVPTWQVNGAAAVLAKQSSAFEQHPTTVVDPDADVYDAVHVAAHE